MKHQLKKYSTYIFVIALIGFLLINNFTADIKAESPLTSRFITDTVYIHDTVYIRDTVQVINYVDTTPIIFHKKAFLYIKDTFNIDERTYYITENDDTVKVFYFDYTYYVFNYTFKDTLVKVDSVIGCDLYTHCICDDRERVVIFHTCEGESRMIINMLRKEGR